MTNYVDSTLSAANAVMLHAQKIQTLELGKAGWEAPQSNRLQIGTTHMHIVRADGTIEPGLEAIHREIILEHNRRIAAEKVLLEEARLRLAQLTPSTS